MQMTSFLQAVDETDRRPTGSLAKVLIVSNCDVELQSSPKTDAFIYRLPIPFSLFSCLVTRTRKLSGFRSRRSLSSRTPMGR